MNKSSKHSASRKASSTSKSALGGLVGGTVATAILHPLDVLKLRQAVHGNSQNLAVRKSYSTMRGAFFEIKRAEGGSWLRGAYSGVGINCAAGGFGWATYFCGYGLFKSILQQSHPNKPLQTHETFCASFSAGIAQVMISNPLGVVKTRMLMQPTVSRKSVIDTGRDIVNKEGKKVLFTKGLCPSLIGVIHGSIQITIYEFMREKLITSQGKKEPALHETLFMAASSKIAAVLITYPANNVKMNQQAHSGPGDNCKAIDLFRRVGIRGLYRGLGPNLLHVTPNVCLVFLCYELINKVLSSD